MYSNLTDVERIDSPAAALPWAVRALAIDPTVAGAWINVALSHLALMEFSEVELPLRRALVLAPGFVSALTNLSQFLYFDDHLLLAATLARRTLALEPGNDRLALNLSFPLMALGQIEEGFPLYERRLHTSAPAQHVVRRVDRPRWQREPLAGRTLLVWSEQGLGDHFFFARYVPMIPCDQGKVIFECDPRVVDLYRRSFPEVVVVSTRDSNEKTLAAHRVDLQIPISSLPLAFVAETRAAIDDACNGRPWPVMRYLKADPMKVEKWREVLAPLRRRLTIAVSWRGGNLNPANCMHYMNVSEFAGIFRDLPVTIVNAQYSWTPAEIDILSRSVDRFFDPPIDLKNDLDDVAALLACCDLVVSAHTAVMYLGAAQGIETFSFLTGRSWSSHGLDGQPLFSNVRHFIRRSSNHWTDVTLGIRNAIRDSMELQSSRLKA
jgi:hypothetical protein